MTTPPSTRSKRSVSMLQFFGLTYLLSWVIWIPLLLVHFNIGTFRMPEDLSDLVRMFGVIMPAVAAIILTAAVEGKIAVRMLFARLCLWRVPAKWWLATVFVYPVLLVLAAFLYRQTGEPSALSFQAGTISSVVTNLVILAIATLGEEIGWRGVALPGIQRYHAPLPSSLLLGSLWATWHLPFWMLMDTYDRFGAGYVALNYLFIVLLTIFMTWLFNHTRSSLLIASVFHYTFNIVNVIFLQVTSKPGSYILFITLQGFVLILVLLLQKLVRQKTTTQNRS